MYERFPIYAGVCLELEEYGRNRMITRSDWGFFTNSFSLQQFSLCLKTIDHKVATTILIDNRSIRYL
jgi:hypothetical protein